MTAGQVTIIILTYNEEVNIRMCLENVKDWTDDIIIVDSGSRDHTVDIARQYTDKIFYVDQGHWADIRNWAANHANIKYDWILFLDADEKLSEELKNEISLVIEKCPEENAFNMRRRFIFLNKWLKHGGLYPYVLRLFRRGHFQYINAGDVEYATVVGKVGKLRNDMIHHDKKLIATWIDKHNRISERARNQYFIDRQKAGSIVKKDRVIEGGKLKHFIKEYVWDNMPLCLRPFIFFTYSYLFRLGFLDGIEGFYYHSLQAFWYRILIAAKVKEWDMKNTK